MSDDKTPQQRVDHTLDIPPSDLDQTIDPPAADIEQTLDPPDIDQTLDPPTDREHTLDIPRDGNVTLDTLPSDTNHTLDIPSGTRSEGAESTEQDLPGYTLLKRLGSGASGSVWEATQASSGQRVALKILDRINRDHVFRLEMEQLIKLRGHPHIVELLDANLEHNPPFLVMPLFPQNLEYYTIGKASLGLLTTERVARWFGELADALHFVHKRGILHGDVKPPNILLDRDRAKLVDFGQAASIGDSQTRLGTYFYMAPEQAQSALDRSATSNVTWDVYSLAAAIYHLLTGTPPRYISSLEDSLASATSFGEQLQTYADELMSSKLHPIREVNPQCDVELAAIVEKCLALNADDRYQDMGQVLDELQRRQENQPLRALPAEPRYLLKLWLQRNKVLAAFLVVGTVILAATFGQLRAAYDEAESKRQLAVNAQLASRNQLHQAIYQEARSKMLNHQASGAASLARLLESAPDILTHRTELFDAVRHLPVPFYTAKAKRLRWNETGLYLATHQRLFEVEESRIRKSPIGPNSETAITDFQTDVDTGLVVVKKINGWAILDPGSQEVVYQERDSVDLLAVGSGRVATTRGRIVTVRKLKSPENVYTLLHHARVLDLKLSPDGSTLATGSEDRTCRLWDLENQKTGPGDLIDGPTLWHEDAVAQVSFSPDGQSLVTASYDGEVKLWELKSRPRPKKLTKQAAPVTSATFAPDGKIIALATSSGEVSLWNRDGERISSYTVGSNAVKEMAFSRDNRVLAAACGNLVWFLNPQNGRPLYQPVELASTVTSVGFTPNGEVFAGGRDDQWRAWDFHGVPPIPQPIRAALGLKRCRFSPKGEYLVASSRDLAQIYDSTTGKLLKTVDQPGLHDAMMSPHTQELVAVGWRTRLHHLVEDTSIPLNPGVHFEVKRQQAEFSPNGRFLLFSSASAVVLRDNHSRRQVPLPLVGAEHVLFDQAGQNFYATSPESAIFHSMKTGETVNLSPSQQAVFDKDGNLLMVQGSRLVKVERPEDEPKELFSFVGELVINSRGQNHLILRDGKLEVVDSDGKAKEKFAELGREELFDDLYLSPSGKKLALVKGSSLKVWSLTHAQPITGWESLPAAIRHLSFDADDGNLVCSLADNTLHLRTIEFDSDMPSDIRTLEIFHRTGWEADENSDAKLRTRPVEWEKKAEAHSANCVIQKQNFYLSRKSGD